MEKIHFNKIYEIDDRERIKRALNNKEALEVQDKIKGLLEKNEKN